MILLNPGPVNLSIGVRDALMQPDLCHREPEFLNLQEAIRRDLLAIYNLQVSEWASILFAGSGTAAVEAMLASMIPKNGKVLIIENGVYGERMSEIVEAYDISNHRLTYKWGQEINIPDVEDILDADPEVTDIAVVHHETTTGRLNDLAAIAKIGQARDLRILVDGVSSFGAEKLEFDKWGIAACAATANKCLHGAPGLSFVIVRRHHLLQDEQPKRAYYLDLERHCHQQDNHSIAFTQPVHLFYALSQALEELQQEGGWRARRKHYQTLAQKVRLGLISSGVNPMLDEEETSVVLSAYYLPRQLTYNRLHSRLKEQGYVIYAGQGELSSRIFRISTMGALDMGHMDAFVYAFRQVLQGDGVISSKLSS